MVTLDKEDIKRRNELNRERNQPETLIEDNFVSGPSQTLNPLTGRKYEYDSSGKGFMWTIGIGYSHPLLKEKAISKKEPKYISKEKPKVRSPFVSSLETVSFGMSSLKYDPITGGLAKKKEETTSYLEMQKILGQMEVRQRSDSLQNEPFTREAYFKFVDDLGTLVSEYASSEYLTLRSITDAGGLNAALEVIELREGFGHWLRNLQTLEIMKPEKERSFPSISEIKKAGYSLIDYSLGKTVEDVFFIKPTRLNSEENFLDKGQKTNLSRKAFFPKEY